MNTSCVIQVVDDDEGLRISTVFALQAVGFEASSYIDANDFLARGQSEHGILICDVRMPGLNGIELLGLLRERGSTMPVILTTGNANRALRADAMRAGAAAILEKPVDLTTIIAEIERITLERSGSTAPSP